MREFDYSDNNIKRTIEADYFNRNTYIQNLIKYINNSESQTTFAVSGEWGSGKTVFMHQFMYAVKHRNIFGGNAIGEDGKKDMEVFYYNAWENELLKKPSIAILDSIIRKYYFWNKEDKANIQAILDKVGNIAVKVTSSGILELNDFKLESSDEIDIEKIEQDFREAIDYIINKRSCNKVVIVVDELDRCNPTTVITMLEEIKHFYNHDSLCFIFSADFGQLSNTIKKMYGENFDADLYMQRFFDAIFTLGSGDYEKYVNEELLFSIGETNIAHELCKVAIGTVGLSIRETNKFIKKIKTIQKEIFDFDEFYPETSAVKALFVPWALALKYCNSKEYKKLMEGELSIDDIKSYVDTSKELAKWLKDCCYGRRQETTEINIYEVLHDTYKSVFRKAGFKYYGEEGSRSYKKNKILSYIEF